MSLYDALNSASSSIDNSVVQPPHDQDQQQHKFKNEMETEDRLERLIKMLPWKMERYAVLQENNLSAPLVSAPTTLTPVSAIDDDTTTTTITSPPQQQPTKRFLGFGLNYLNTASELKGCINDVNNIKTLLGSGLGSAQNYDEFKIFTDLTPEKPTRFHIETALHWLVATVNSGDTLFVHYSGHGSQVPDKNGDDNDGNDEVLVPLDYQRFGMILDDHLYEALVTLVVKSGKKLKIRVLLDCCHSGTALDLRYKHFLSSANKLTIQEENLKNEDVDIVCISACTDAQTASDVQNTSQPHGALTDAFLKTLTAHYPKLTWRELLTQIHNRSLSYAQTPYLCSEKILDLDSYCDF